MANRPHRARTGGSGFTIISWQSKPVAFCRQISDQSPTPVGPGTVPIHPIDQEHPLELITAQAATMGTLTLELYDRYSKRFWDDLPFLNGANDIVDIFRKINNSPSLGVSKVVRAPDGSATQSWIYHGCVVSQVMDGETVEVGTMEVLKQVIVNYTNVTRS